MLSIHAFMAPITGSVFSHLCVRIFSSEAPRLLMFSSGIYDMQCISEYLCGKFGVAFLRFNEFTPDVRHAASRYDARNRLKIVVHLVTVRLHRPFEMPQLFTGNLVGPVSLLVIEVTAVALRAGVPGLPGITLTATLVWTVSHAPGNLVHL